MSPVMLIIVNDVKICMTAVAAVITISTIQFEIRLIRLVKDVMQYGNICKVDDGAVPPLQYCLHD